MKPRKKNLTRPEYIELFTLRHNFRKFPNRGRHRGLSPIQVEGLNIPIDDWSDLVFSEDAAME